MNTLSAIGVLAIILLIILFMKGKIGEAKCEAKGFNGYTYSMGCYIRNGGNIEYEEWEKKQGE